jgi:hypothetical protein
MWAVVLVLLLAGTASAATPRGLLATIIRRTCAQERGPFLRLLDRLEQEAAESVTNGPVSVASMGGAIDSSEDSLGPIFLDHTETIGGGRVNMNLLNEPNMAFGSVNGKSLDPLEGADPVIFEQTDQPTTAARVGLDLDLRQASFGLAVTYGLTDRLDASVLLPLVYTSVQARAFRQVTDVLSPSGKFLPVRNGKVVTASGSASGFRQGDLGVRLKYALPSLGPVYLATGLMAYFPTGVPEYLTGTGDYWLEPLLAAALPVGNRGLVAATAGMLIDLSDASRSKVTYGIGAGYALIPGRLGALVEFLGQSQISSAVSPGDTSVLTLLSNRTLAEQPALGVLVHRNDEFNLSVGLRAPLATTLPVGLMLFASAIIPLNQDGMRPSGAFFTVGLGGMY